MLVYILLMALSAITSGLFTYFFELYKEWWQILLMILAILGFYVIYFILYMLFLAVVILFSTNRNKEVKKPKNFHCHLMHSLMFFLLRYARIKMKVTGLDKVPDGRVMVICNHKSNFDPMPLMYYIKPSHMVAVTKPENISVPIYGKYMHNMGFIRMPKENTVESVKAIVKASNYIKNDITSVLIFPEGKRNFEDSTLDFHPGSFKIATKTKCPIVVTSIKDTDKVRFNFPLKRTIVNLDVIDVLYYEDYKELTTVDLANNCREMIVNKLKEYKN